ncbi:MAG: ATP-grasp domain-containing protein [Candidatus Saccharimonas sp.]
MNLLEYEAKSVLTRYNIPTPQGNVYRTGDPEPAAPVVLKSQVHAGGRGKLGGVKVVTEQYDVTTVANSLLRLEISGELPQTLLAEEVIAIAHEYYVSLIIDRSAAAIELVAHRDGGVDIESHAPTEFYKKIVTPEQIESIGEGLAEYFELPAQSFALQDIVQNLYRCFIESDATLIEINPLVLTRDDRLVAADCKMTVDDAANFRHSEWQFEQEPTNTNFVTLNTNGTVATIANGAGLAMATVDAIQAKGLVTANFLDIGGAATVGGIMRSFESILEFPSVSAIVINIFGGIVRCDEVAAAIIEATEQFDSLPKLYIRLSGNRSTEAAQLLEARGMTPYPDLSACLEEVARG